MWQATWPLQAKRHHLSYHGQVVSNSPHKDGLKHEAGRHLHINLKTGLVLFAFFNKSVVAVITIKTPRVDAKYEKRIFV